MRVGRLADRKLIGIELRDAVAVLATLLAMFMLGYNYLRCCNCNGCDKIKGFEKDL